LEHSIVRGIALAVAIDTARIVADRVDGGSVEGVLRHANLLEVPIVDLIAASYFELGKLDEAVETNRLAAMLDNHASDATVCHRLVRAIASTPDGDARERSIADLEHLATPVPPKPNAPHPRPPDATCVELGKAVGVDVGDPIAVALRRARSAWPSGAGSFEDWQNVFTLGIRALPDPRAVELAVRAIELEIEASQCDRSLMPAIRADAAELRLRVRDRDAIDDVNAVVRRIGEPKEQCVKELRDELAR
jgi:hypothetical protein